MKRFKFNIILYILAIHFQAFAQSSKDQILSLVPELENKFKDFKSKNHLSAVSYALILNGEIIYDGHLGIINHESQTKPDGHSVYRIASMSKSFASVAILQLRDAGKLKLEDPVWKFIPELKGQKYSKSSAEITIKHLLTHAAGFPEDNPWGDRQLGISEKQMLQMFKKGISFSNEPGITYEYSNMAFAMLGQIIKKVSKKPYQEYIREKIWQPLGMSNTYWEYTQVPDNQLVKGYRWINEKHIEQPIEHDGAYGIMGGVLTSIEDFAKYIAFHQSTNNESDRYEKILKNSSIKEIHFPANFNSLNRRGFTETGQPCENVSFYGYGVRIDQNCNQMRSVGHSGGLPGYGSDWKILPQYGLGIVTLTNGTYGQAALMNNQILPYILGAAHLKPIPFPVSNILQQRQNELLQYLPHWDGADKSTIFAENFFLDNYIDLLQSETEANYKKAGKILSIKPMVAENALRGTFQLIAEKGILEVSFTLSPENPPLIQAYSIRFKEN